MVNRLWVLIGIVFLIAACSQEPEVEPTVSPPVTPTLETAESAAPATTEPTPRPTITTPASPTPQPVPTPAPLRITADTAVPQAIQQAVQELANANPSRFQWVESDGDVTIKVNAGEPIGSWVYAAAAPFPTFTDEIGSADLETAWQEGTLHVDGETAAVLAALWGEPGVSAEIISPENLVSVLWQAQTAYETAEIALLPFDRLVPELKVLAVDGFSPVATDFDPAAYSLTVPIGLVGEPAAVEQLQAALTEPLTNRDDNKITQVAMTGPAGMRRAVADRMEKYGLTYPAEETGPVLQGVDIAHMSNENAFANDCPMPDPFDSSNVCNRDEYVELMTWMGIDINEMTGNHLNDWGTDSLLHTFDLYDEVGIQTFGGGRNLAAAQEPLLIEHNGNKLAFVGCNPVGPPIDWAGENYPGSLPCGDYDFILNQISDLDAAGYLVFATLQYLEYYQYEVFEGQRTDFHNLAAAGATAVSGSQGHHPQGFSFFDGSFIHYGLGNLLADQMFSLGTRQTFIDIYTIYDGRLINVTLWTGLIEDYARQRLMTAEERETVLQSVFEVSDWSCCGS
ncbi:MAG: CapA family protein [Candidatus Promineifilaceae bacterium]